MISRAMEDYLKVIYQFTSDKDKVSTSNLAQQMDCSPASVTNMLQKLAELKLVEYEPYQGVTLTPAGSKVALEILRHHRLIELYLADVLGYSWDKVHAEAEQLEHVISEEFEEKIDRALGHPTIDPHGDPIPTKEGKIAVLFQTSLEKDPNFPDAHYNLAATCEKLSLWDAAFTHWKSYLNLDPVGKHADFARKRIKLLQSNLVPRSQK